MEQDSMSKSTPFDQPGPAETRRDEPRPRTIASTLEHQARRRGGSIAVDDGETRLTYAELIARARSVGDLITPLEGPIGILLPVSTEYIVAIVATLLAGKAYVPMDESFPEKRNLRIVRHSGMAAVIVDARTAPSMVALDASVKRIDVASAIERREDIPVLRVPRSEPDDPIVTIFYTSGSTGEPKGVCQSEAALIYDIDEYIDQAGLTPDDRATLLYSPSVSSSNRDIYGALLGGARLCIIDLKALGLAAATAALRAHRVTLYHSVPGVFRSLFGAGTEGMDDVVRSIRWMRLNGDRVLPSDVALYKRVFPRATGLCLDMASTETKAYASWMLDHDTPVNGPLVPVGYPRADLRVLLLGDDGAPVAAGDVGEIVVTSPSLSVGYWRDEALTRERFTPSAAFPGMTEYRTGDFGRLLPDGLLEFVGRRDRQVKVRGNTVHLGEVEAVIATCPGVAEASVVGRQSEGGVRLIAYCVAGPGFGTPADVRSWCRDHLSAAMWPAEVIAVANLPRLVTGKVDLVELDRMDVARARDDADTRDGASSSTRSAIELTWSECLGQKALQRDLTFEEAGGDSLQAMLLLLALERRLRRSLPNALIDGTTRPSELTARVQALQASTSDDASDSRPTMFFFTGVYGSEFALIAFARQLAARFNVVVLDYRNAAPDFIGPVDREQIFQELDEHLSADGVPERLWVIGYSIGSRVAAEAARRLLERGIVVEFIGLIDGPSDSGIAARNQRRVASGTLRPPLAKRISSHGGLFNFFTARVAGRITHGLVARGDFARVRMLAATLSRVGLKEASKQAARVALIRTRARAFKNLVQAPLPAPISLFVSTAPYSEARFTPDLGWSEWCTDLQIHQLPGDHNDVLSGAGGEALLGVFGETEQRLRHIRAA